MTKSTNKRNRKHSKTTDTIDVVWVEFNDDGTLKFRKDTIDVPLRASESNQVESRPANSTDNNNNNPSKEQLILTVNKYRKELDDSYTAHAQKDKLVNSLKRRLRCNSLQIKDQEREIINLRRFLEDSAAKLRKANNIIADLKGTIRSGIDTLNTAL